ncbi:hypothetical protein Glove_193g15 [Diversispora epigaea]|uniref:Uncharacterized protein n=1 Tax=Diversispora epigaea TaxID=1348612 RepID=A0A397IP85_9GLOM|nr:hypothetical protein Glove_193g15 [Diversispora epigaea]
MLLDFISFSENQKLKEEITELKSLTKNINNNILPPNPSYEIVNYSEEANTPHTSIKKIQSLIVTKKQLRPYTLLYEQHLLTRYSSGPQAMASSGSVQDESSLVYYFANLISNNVSLRPQERNVFRIAEVERSDICCLTSHVYLTKNINNNILPPNPSYEIVNYSEEANTPHTSIKKIQSLIVTKKQLRPYTLLYEQHLLTRYSSGPQAMASSGSVQDESSLDEGTVFRGKPPRKYIIVDIRPPTQSRPAEPLASERVKEFVVIVPESISVRSSPRTNKGKRVFDNNSEEEDTESNDEKNEKDVRLKHLLRNVLDPQSTSSTTAQLQRK